MEISLLKLRRKQAEELIAKVPAMSWKNELEATSFRYHFIAAWVAIIFDPLFALTDYFNIPHAWETLFYVRLSVAALTLAALFVRMYLQLPSFVIAIVPFMLISLQNAFTYSLIGNENLLGHNLNYMALFIGASMFVAWRWLYSLGAVIISAFATAWFILSNELLSITDFFVNGGLLLIASGIFMFVLIRTRYELTVKEIKARLALQISNEEIHARNQEIQTQNEEIHSQAEEIKGINENLEAIVMQRTRELEMKNRALEEYAFINAHQLRSPVASILGLINLANKVELNDEAKVIMAHLQESTDKLDKVVTTITKAIERGDKPTPYIESSALSDADDEA
jgi:signal transduction histidine kinase